MRRPMSRLTLLAAALALAGCSLAPDYKVPPVPASVAYRTVGPWAPARPSDQIPRDAWWQAYREPALDALETRLLASNADLAAALAHYAQARAFVSQQSAAELPRVSATASPTRNRQSDTRRCAAPAARTSTTPSRWAARSTTSSICGAACATRWRRPRTRRRPPRPISPRCN